MTQPSAQGDQAMQDIPRFWDWSARKYQNNGASALLLSLQDEYNLNVNMLLWCLWLASYFGETPDKTIKSARDVTDLWSADIAGGLRRVRRALKSPPRQADAPKAQALRKKVKKAELQAEELEQEMLQSMAVDQLPVGAQKGDEVAARPHGLENLRRYVRLTGAADSLDDALLRKLSEIILNGA